MSALTEVVERLEAGRSVDQVALELGLARDMVAVMADHAGRVGRLVLLPAPPSCGAGCPMAAGGSTGSRWLALACSTCAVRHS